MLWRICTTLWNKKQQNITKHIFLYNVTKSEDHWKTSNAFQGKTMQKHQHQRPAKLYNQNQCEIIINTLLHTTYTLPKHHTSSQVSALAKHPLTYLLQQNILSCISFSRISFHLSASAKHRLIRWLLEKHHMTHLNVQRSRNFHVKDRMVQWRILPDFQGRANIDIAQTIPQNKKRRNTA